MPYNSQVVQVSLGSKLLSVHQHTKEVAGRHSPHLECVEISRLPGIGCNQNALMAPAKTAA